MAPGLGVLDGLPLAGGASSVEGASSVGAAVGTGTGTMGKGSDGVLLGTTGPVGAEPASEGAGGWVFPGVGGLTSLGGGLPAVVESGLGGV